MSFRQAHVGWILLLLWITPVQAASFVAGGTTWRPYSYEDEQGTARGISVDITRHVMQMAGIDISFVFYPVNRLQTMLTNDRIDLNYADSAQWNSTDDLHRYVFSIPYMQVEEHLYFLASHPARNTPVDKLSNLTLGVIRGYMYRSSLDPMFAEKRAAKLETSQDLALIKLLQSKRVDAVAMVDDLFNYLVSQQNLDPTLFHKGALLGNAPLVIKLQPEHAQWLPKINSAIETMVRSGEVERIRKAYLPARLSANKAECTLPGNN